MAVNSFGAVQDKEQLDMAGRSLVNFMVQSATVNSAQQLTLPILPCMISHQSTPWLCPITTAHPPYIYMSTKAQQYNQLGRGHDGMQCSQINALSREQSWHLQKVALPQEHRR
jgi:hypothetical protein